MIYQPQLAPPPVAPHIEPLRCDVLLFVATTTEKEKLREVATGMGLTFTRINRSFRYYDLGQVGSYQRVLAVKTEIGPFSQGGSAARALMAVAETKATAIISVGMAFGVNRGQQRHGDVLVSSALFTYDDRLVHSTKRRCGKSDYSELEPYYAKASLLNSLRSLSSRNEWNNRVRFGPMLTGGARIHCRKFRDELVKALSREDERIIGGEMEGAGLLAASDPDAPTWVVVKGICDFADRRRDEEFEVWRDSACENAARFVLTALRDFEPPAEN